MDSTIIDKFCPRCRVDKLISEFSRNRTKKDGFADWCKSCTKTVQDSPEQIEKARLRSARWRSIPGNKEKHKRWRELPASRQAARVRSANEKILHRDKVWARTQIHLAILRGDILRGQCEVCQSDKTDAHHDDYEKPFDVRWLCRKHHAELHQRKGGQWTRLH